MGSIDWDAVRRKGEQGMLTAKETDALCEMAWWTEAGHPAKFCELCTPIKGWEKWRHDDDCPISVLKEVGDER